MKEIHGVQVNGVNVDAETRCAHYHGPADIIALKFKCCGAWYPCHLCHAAAARHQAVVWPKQEFETRAILCGGCGYQLTIAEYLVCDSCCPRCLRRFNPRCARHPHLYFDT